jgi:RNA polymerase sigma-70 factor (ECF subfamily)
MRFPLYSPNDNGAAEDVRTLSDEEVFERYRSGQSEMLRILIDRHHDDLLRFLYRLMGDRQAAEDVFQEAFLQVHLSASTFDATRRFRPWLFTIAANKGRDHLRRRGRQQSKELSAPVGGGGRNGDSISFLDLMEVDVPRPGQGLDRAERDAQVQKALEALSPTLREILLLAYFQRLPYAQIADELEIPLGTVKSRLHAAVASFGKQYKKLTSKSEDD